MTLGRYVKTPRDKRHVQSHPYGQQDYDARQHVFDLRLRIAKIKHKRKFCVRPLNSIRQRTNSAEHLRMNSGNSEPDWYHGAKVTRLNACSLPKQSDMRIRAAFLRSRRCSDPGRKQHRACNAWDRKRSKQLSAIQVNPRQLPFRFCGQGNGPSLEHWGGRRLIV